MTLLWVLVWVTLSVVSCSLISWATAAATTSNHQIIGACATISAVWGIVITLLYFVFN